MHGLVRQFIDDESGATIVEYAILVALIAMVAFVIVYALGETLEASYQNTLDCMENPPGCNQ